jgi:hypothetical protein
MTVRYPTSGRVDEVLEISGLSVQSSTPVSVQGRRQLAGSPSMPEYRLAPMESSIPSSRVFGPTKSIVQRFVSAWNARKDGQETSRSFTHHPCILALYSSMFFVAPPLARLPHV